MTDTGLRERTRASIAPLAVGSEPRSLAVVGVAAPGHSGMQAPTGRSYWRSVRSWMRTQRSPIFAR